MSKIKRLAIIPARCGSKRIPNKNIRKFCGRPIIHYVLDIINESKLFDTVHVSTDCEQIRKNVTDFAKRSNITTLDTASDYGNSEQVLGEIGVDDYRIVTKTIPLADGADKSIDGFYTSLKNLNVKQVDGLLIHNINDIKDKKFNVFFEKLNELKQ
jgi:CMP-N-acetylneuraminic acid synthetase